jgi:NADPH-dependent curcumin reductase CurA
MTAPTQATSESRQIVLRRRPAKELALDDFALETVSLPALSAEQIQVRNLWMSVDPYMRRRMFEDTGYAASFELGKPLEGAAIGEVVESRDESFPVGSLVESSKGWRERFNTERASLKKLDARGLPPEIFLAEAGSTGLAAYVGLTHIAGVKAGERLFVSAAAGAVGSVACQIGIALGCTVIASAGGAAKRDYLESIGIPHVIDYRATTDLAGSLARVAPDGIDVYFDNVGGEHLQAALEVARPFARFALCGMISQGSGKITPTSPPPANLLLAVTKRIRLQGFIVGDYAHEAGAFAQDMSAWIANGQIKPKSTVRIGISNAPAALMDLFKGANIGKMLVKLA